VKGCFLRETGRVRGTAGVQSKARDEGGAEDQKALQVIYCLTSVEQHQAATSIVVALDRCCFWLAVNGKPVLFWKSISGLKFPCFQFYAC